MKDFSVDELKRFQKQLAQFSAERHETQISKLQKSLIEQRKEELGLRCEVPNDKCCYDFAPSYITPTFIISNIMHLCFDGIVFPDHLAWFAKGYKFILQTLWTGCLLDRAGKIRPRRNLIWWCEWRP